MTSRTPGRREGWQSRAESPGKRPPCPSTAHGSWLLRRQPALPASPLNAGEGREGTLGRRDCCLCPGLPPGSAHVLVHLLWGGLAAPALTPTSQGVEASAALAHRGLGSLLCSWERGDPKAAQPTGLKNGHSRGPFTEEKGASEEEEGVSKRRQRQAPRRTGRLRGQEGLRASPPRLRGTGESPGQGQLRTGQPDREFRKRKQQLCPNKKQIPTGLPRSPPHANRVPAAESPRPPCMTHRNERAA